MSRKKSLKTMSSLIGNAAAHLALEPKSAFSLREAWLYQTQAEEEAAMRSWNDEEIEFFRNRAQSYARNEIKKRTHSHHGRSEEQLIATALSEIEGFIDKELGKRDKRKKNR